MIQDFPFAEALIHLAADQPGKFAEAVVEGRRDELGDELPLARVVGLQGVGHGGGDVLVGDLCPAGLRGQRGVPGRHFGGGPEVDIEEMPLRSQPAHGFGEEFFDVSVAMAALDVHDGVEAGVGKRQLLDVAHGEGEVGDRRVPLLAARHGLGRAVGAGDSRRTMIPRDKARPAAATGPDLKHLAAGEIHGGGHAVVELNAIPVGFILLRQGDFTGSELIISKRHEKL